MAEVGTAYDERVTLVPEEEDQGCLDAEESYLICSAVRFDDLDASDILTPRVDIVALEDTATMEEATALFAQEGYSRMPVYHESLDNVVGVIHQKDLFAARYHGRTQLAPLIHPVLHVTTSTKIDDLMRQFQRTKTHMAIVVDEYGGTEGLLTMEDVVEELVGDIWDEHDEVVENFAKVDEGRYFVQGEVTLADFFEYFGIKKDPSEFETVTLGGLIAQLAGKVPAVGEEVKFENLTLKVLSVEYYKVTQAEVTVSSTQEGAKSRSEEE